jgi:hypothetical protein
MNKLSLSIAFVLTTIFSLFATQDTFAQQATETGPVVGSVYWSPYHHDGNAWVGPVVYYLYSNNKCFVRASGIQNRYGGERTGRVMDWKRNGNNVVIEGHTFTIVGDQVLLNKDRVFFKANSLSEAYNLIYQQTTTTVAN